MASAQEFFLTESEEHLNRLDELLASSAGEEADIEELARLARGVRGSGRLAGADAVVRVATQLQGVARALASGELVWSDEVAGRLRATVDDLRALIEAGAEADVRERVAGALARWPELDAAADHGGGDGADGGGREFLEFAAVELAGLLSVLDSSIPALARDARDREPLKAVLRRERALQGAAGLERLPAAAETLATLDEATHLIADRNVAVEGPWLELYRAARDVVAALVPPLESAERPEPPTGALERLRSLCERLVDEESGEESEGQEREAVEPEPAAPEPAAPAREEPTAAPVPIDELLYRGDAALGRALELRPRIEPLAADDSDARAAVDELFDLIRLGMEREPPTDR